jgi:hypothetical protein
MAGPVLAIVRTSADLCEAFRRRIIELDVSLETVDHIAGLPTRYTAKIIGAQPTRKFGQMSFEALLGALGLMLLVVEDTEALARVRARLEPLQRAPHDGWRTDLKHDEQAPESTDAAA